MTEGRTLSFDEHYKSIWETGKVVLCGWFAVTFLRKMFRNTSVHVFYMYYKIIPVDC